MKSMIAFAALALLSAPAMAEESVSLSGAVRKTLGHSYDLKSRSAMVDQARAVLHRADAMALPGFQFRSELTEGDDPVYVFGSLLRQSKFGMSDFALDKLNTPDAHANFSNSVEMNVPLFTGYRIRDYKRLGGAAVAQGEAALGFAGSAAAFETVQKYLVFSLKNELARLAGEAARLTSVELETADRLKARGLVLGSDYYAARAILGSLNSARTGFEKDAQAAQASLLVMMGVETGARLSLAGGLARHVYQLPSEGELLAGLEARRGDIAAAKLQADAAAIARGIEENSSLPQIGAFASLTSNTGNFSTNPIRQTAGVGLTLPFGDFTRSARVEEKEAARRQAENAALALRDGVAAQVAQYYRDYEGALAVLPQAEEAVADAERSLELFKPLFRQGRQSVLEVARAEAALMSARASRAEIIFKLHSIYAALMFVSGRLDWASVEGVSAALSGDKK